VDEITYDPLEPCFMKSSLSAVNHDRAKGKRIAFALVFSFLLMPVENATVP